MLHQPISLLSPGASALGLLTAYALESRVGWAPARKERTNKRTKLSSCSCECSRWLIAEKWLFEFFSCTGTRNYYKNSSGDEIVNVNFCTTTTYM